MPVVPQTSPFTFGTYRNLREATWLREEMAFIWETFFSDVPRPNDVQIEFSGPWKARLGVITMSLDQQTSYIGINALLRFPEVPTYITTITVAHELVHYAHGFGSPLPRRYKYPHRGGIVQKELFRRGLRQDFDLYVEWIERHWFGFYDRCIGDGQVVLLSGPTTTPTVNFTPSRQSTRAGATG